METIKTTQSISDQSPQDYSKAADSILTADIKDKLKAQIEVELLEEYNPVFSKANWFQRIGLNFKLQRLKQQRTQHAFQNYLDAHQHPKASDESSW